MNKDQNSKWLVDIALFAGFMLAFFPDLTGLELHQWTGLAAGGLASYHLVAHWTWVSNVTQRFFGKTSSRSRLYYLIDVAIFAGFFTISLTGLVISSWLNLTLAHHELWLHLHIQVSILTLILVVAKTGLHWRWIVATTRRIFSQPIGQAQHASPILKPAPVAVPILNRQQISRRDFIKIMGIVGVVSFFALASAASGLHEPRAAVTSGEEDIDVEINSSEETTSSQQASSGSIPESFNSDQSCSVQCGHRCSYPGHCRRYTDTNGNNLCDFGECAEEVSQPGLEGEQFSRILNNICASPS
jgi:hypothetical protein